MMKLEKRERRKVKEEEERDVLLDSEGGGGERGKEMRAEEREGHGRGRREKGMDG